MTSYALGAKGAIEVVMSSVHSHDAQTLQKAIREAIVTSPDAFLKTIDDVDAKSVYDWEIELKSATWAVVQRGEEVVGIAAAKWPDPKRDRDIDDLDTARFIESVWIAPGLRGKRMGERLVKYLFEVECRRNPHIKQFLLWVFEENGPAIKLYERMGFTYTGVRKQWPGRTGMIEAKYRLPFDSAVRVATDLAVNEASRRQDFREGEVRYRVLGEDFA